jgi:hypothetical protein
MLGLITKNSTIGMKFANAFADYFKAHQQK